MSVSRIRILLADGRLEIAASVDLAGLRRLYEILVKQEAVLEIMAQEAPLPSPTEKDERE